MSEGPSESGVPAGNQVVYRPEAITAHRKAREFTRAPQFMSPRKLTVLWAASLATVLFGLALTAVPVPVHVPGTAVIIPAARVPGATEEGLVLVAFFPPEARAKLAAGQRILVDVGGSGVRVESRLREVSPSVLSPEVAAERFGLKSGSGQAPSVPASYAFAVFVPPQTGLSAESWLGSSFRVDVEVGQQRLLAHVPVLAQFLEG
ncbi:hypothetical protein [Hyalangium versicolor]|uniref:hypothetical protein n=1 Tax=Hyalangium versicolor TaxID=2861190 RepID=UPI001CD00639|nr:hypothetical protein [Hyalangium versicolor]